MKQLFIFLLCVVLTPAALAMRCGNQLVNTGDTIHHVEKLCGKPTAVYQWQETEKRYRAGYPTHSRPMQTDKPITQALPQYEVPVYITINYARLTYNRGSTQFVNYLVFRNGVLERIVEGEYGN